MIELTRLEELRKFLTTYKSTNPFEVNKAKANWRTRAQKKKYQRKRKLDLQNQSWMKQN